MQKATRKSSRRAVIGVLLAFSSAIVYTWYHLDAPRQSMVVEGIKKGSWQQALGGGDYLDSLARTLLDKPGTLESAAGDVYNASVCAIITNEDKYIDEWILYHRLMGIERFHLYDFEASPGLAQRLLPYVEAGIVDLHTITFEDPSIPSDNFHGRMLNHCIENYTRKTRWFFHFDVDEFIILTNLLNYERQPYQLGGDAATSPWLYPLHDLLLSQRFRRGRCVSLSREGVFRNVGVVSLDTQESVLESLYYRESRRGVKQAGKVLIQSSPEGLLANFAGAHGCTVSKMPHVDGVQDWDREALRDSSGRVGNGQDPGISEPIAVAHFDQRTLDDCKTKLSHITDPNNWRILNGGVSRCSKLFVPTREQLATGVFKDSPDYDLILQIDEEPLVEDRTMIDSWYGQQTSILLRKLRAGASLPLRNAAAAQAAITRLTVPNPT